MAAVLTASVVAVPSTASGDEPRPPRAADTAAKPDLGYADYIDTDHTFAADHPVLCLIDNTSGFPVEAAVAEFDGLVDMVVLSECPDGDSIVPIEVVTINNRQLGHAGWWNQRLDDDGHVVEGRISLNLAEAHRMDPTRWRLLLVHELGHAAGLDHTQEVTSIMQPDADAYVPGGLSESDREQLEQIYGGAR